MDERHSVSELELLAYADGLLDADPIRKAAVENRLRESPDEAERVCAHRAQNEALRRRYDKRIHDPVPSCLYAALDAPARRPLRTLARIAATATVLVAVGLIGWLVGQSDQPHEWSAEDFVRLSYNSYERSLPGMNTTATSTQTGTINAMQWLSQRISLSLKVPDLGEAGYVVADRRTMTVGGDQFVRLTYTSRDGRSFDLFLQPRWEDSEPGIRVTQEKDVSLAYWFDGPLAHAVVSRLSPAETRELALAVRRAMHDPDASAPAVQLTPSPKQGVGVANGDHRTKDPTRPLGSGVPMLPTDPGRGRISTN